MAKITLRSVVKKFGDVEAVRGINLDLPDGEIAVLVGPSGCGKSTTLRMIAGLEKVTSGVITIGETNVTSLEPRDRDVAMVFQNYALYPHLSVLENIAFPLQARGQSKVAARSRASEVAETLGISELLKRKPAALSGGQQQRVAIGRAIARNPKVFLFDEPLSNLDAKLRVAMRTEILRLQRQLGTTAVYVTHDQEEAMTLSDTMVVMRDGIIAQQGKPSELYSHPIDDFVAGFIGSPQMNFFEGAISDGDFVAASPKIKLPTTAAPHGHVTLGVRPEDVLVGREEPGDFRATVEIIELLGPRAIVTLRHDGGNLTSVMEAAELRAITEGARVPVSIRPGGLHLFDGETGRRVKTN
jgi:multiple sugar transport system ATP-binding protein